jgi:RNA polymerase I-specific transcription initiation factor RRN7
MISFEEGHALIFVQKVVRDLWELRLRSLVDKFDDSQEEDDATQLFSSQAPTAAATTDAEDETDQETSLTARKPTDNPRLVETLGLCYLAALLLRLPVSIGDIHR